MRGAHSRAGKAARLAPLRVLAAALTLAAMMAALGAAGRHFYVCAAMGTVSSAAITAAAMSDPDAVPFTDSEWEQVKPL